MPEQDVALSSTSAASVRSRPAVRRRLIVILGGLAILVFAFGMVWLQSSKYELLVVGMTAPNFSLPDLRDRKSTRLNSSHSQISYAVFCLKKKKKKQLTMLCNVHSTDTTKQLRKG